MMRFARRYDERGYVIEKPEALPCYVSWNEKDHIAYVWSPDSKKVLGEMLHARVTSITRHGVWIAGMETIDRKAGVYRNQEWLVDYGATGGDDEHVCRHIY